MLMLIRIALILLLFFTPLALTFGLERDKVLHAATAFTGQVLCSAVATEVIEQKLPAALTCSIIVTGAGIAAEAGLFGKNEPDLKDIAANSAGVVLGLGVVQWKF